MVATAAWDADVTGTVRGLALRRNGVTFVAMDQRAPVALPFVTAGVVVSVENLVAGDYVELLAYQDTAGNLKLVNTGEYTPEVEMALVAAAPVPATSQSTPAWMVS